jgi:hypothetical protein
VHIRLPSNDNKEQFTKKNKKDHKPEAPSCREKKRIKEKRTPHHVVRKKMEKREKKNK